MSEQAPKEKDIKDVCIEIGTIALREKNIDMDSKLPPPRVEVIHTGFSGGKAV